MAYKTKPELEEGNFIVYTNEPDTVMDAGSSGGGGGNFGKCSFTIVIDKGVEDPTVFDNKIKLNGELLSGFVNKILPGDETPVPVLDVTADAFSLLEIPPDLISGVTYTSNGGGFIEAVYGDKVPVNTTVYTPTPAFNGTTFTIVPD